MVTLVVAAWDSCSSTRPPSSTRSTPPGRPQLREDRPIPGPAPASASSPRAYCTRRHDRVGPVAAEAGIAAADPEVLPAGSVVQIASGGGQHDGVYTIMDTGPVVKGRRIDIYTWNCDEALRFGRRTVQLFVLRLGWNPRASGQSLLDSLLPWRDTRRPSPAPPRLPSRPLPSTDLPQFPDR